jgi:hypothetical protein
MAMTRRQFGWLAGGGVVGALCALANRSRRAAREVASRVFPGRVRPLRDDDVRRVGRWAG